MTLGVELHPKDYLEFNLYHNLNTPLLKKQTWFIRIFVVFIALVAVVLFKQPETRWVYAIPVVVGVGGYFTVPLLLKWQLTNRIRKAILSGRGSQNLGKGTITLEPEAVRWIVGTQDRKLPYSGVERVVENQEWTYIYFGSATALIVADRYFSTPQEKKKFFALLENKAPQLRPPATENHK